MLDPANATHEDFEAMLKRRFRVAPDGAAPLELELVGVERRGSFDPALHRRQAFALLFVGPDAPVLPQRIYRLEDATAAALEIFLVPIGPQAQGMGYEAVFT